MAETGNKVVQLNQDIGYYLLNFLDGVDACNFLEVVNQSSQFRSIATTSDHTFRALITMFWGHHRILLSRETYGKYLHDCKVVDDKLVFIENRNSSFIQPLQRLFVYRCFSIEGFNKLCKAYRTSLFQCYSRLLPFNTDLYSADFGLLDYELYNETIGLKRDLNDYERKLFRSKKYGTFFFA